MARSSTFCSAVAFLFVFVILAEVAVQARHCHPPCESHERCVSADPRERRSNDNICVARGCLSRPRRGRCLNFEDIWHFDFVTMDCRRDFSGSCYGSNRFTSREDCELTCVPWYRR